MMEMLLFQLMLEYDHESDNVFVLHREIIGFEKEMRNRNEREVSSHIE